MKRYKSFDRSGNPTTMSVPPKEREFGALEKREYATAVFKVEGVRRFCETPDETETLCVTLCVTQYAVLIGVTRGAAIRILKKKVAQENRVSELNVSFQFWCDGTSHSAGTPIEIR